MKEVVKPTRQLNKLPEINNLLLFQIQKPTMAKNEVQAELETERQESRLNSFQLYKTIFPSRRVYIKKEVKS